MAKIQTVTSALHKSVSKWLCCTYRQFQL